METQYQEMYDTVHQVVAGFWALDWASAITSLLFGFCVYNIVFGLKIGYRRTTMEIPGANGEIGATVTNSGMHVSYAPPWNTKAHKENMANFQAWEKRGENNVQVSRNEDNSIAKIVINDS